MKTVKLAFNAMATRFELVLLGVDERHLRASGEEVAREVKSLESRLSIFSPSSEISVLNRSASRESIKIAPDLFELFLEVQSLVAETGGAFDPTIGGLMQYWGFRSGGAPTRRADELETALRSSGFNHVSIDTKAHTVAFTVPGVSIDLGGIGKGYALDKAAEMLRSLGINNALIHGGTSTVIGLGESFDSEPWKIGVQDEHALLGTVSLSDCALSVSGASGRRIIVEGENVGHVLDPRSGHPAEGAAVAAVTDPRATRADALSTAALVLGEKADVLSSDNTGVGVWRTSDPHALLVVSGLPNFNRNPTAS